jgi:DNA-directed RNA polymerase subunit F
MRVLSRTPIAISSVTQYISDFEDKQALEKYLKTFSKLEAKKAEALVEDLMSLSNAKIKLSDSVKVADLLPKTVEELNKIFNDVSLSEEESNKILDIVKKY